MHPTADSLLDIAHPAVPVVRAEPAQWVGLADAQPARQVDLDRLVTAAGHCARLLPPAVHDALVDFGDIGHPAGALLLRGLPVGELPSTPTQRGATGKSNQLSELLLLTIARRLGQPVGYAPEHGGALVQNLIPLPDTRAAQVSTSSDVDLFFHTETAFHPYRPRYLVLLCLRGDRTATTTLCSVTALLGHLCTDDQSVLRQPRFRIGVDASFGGSRSDLGDPVAVLSGNVQHPTLLFDADLMIGTDTEAEAVLQRLVALVAQQATGVVLETGDALLIDNTAAVHGRSQFAARFDGTDRWLQRAFVVSDLAPSALERTGRIITKRW
jgi:L-asparagine oxygenase